MFRIVSLKISPSTSLSVNLPYEIINQTHTV
nr:MAG TPA_asm: hypothetical protein [Bacteriophage sp.]